jgi:DNA-binding transcriptional regulator YiaG
MQNKSITRPQNRLPAERRLQMVEQFRRSGLTGAAFSRQYGISLSTLKWWLKKERRASNLPAPLIFSEVRLEPAEKVQGNGWAMEIVAPSGWTVRSRDQLPVQDLARLIRSGRC